MTHAAAVEAAFSWHGGGGSPLYTFASWGGRVFGAGHWLLLRREIRGVVATTQDEAQTLGELLAYVANIPLDDEPEKGAYWTHRADCEG